ncbi:MAG: cytochrome c nitrite reductase small subunit [Bacteroidales bacterium]|jgi:cytochrome c nitrite reductase small subunit|nr:cytochrome c nitrite reductase small subunit [Bacteroidales bacterium]
MSRQNRLIRFFSPPPQWRLPVIVLLGAFTGLAFYLLKISNATSYLSDDPRVCINCHIMTPQFATWSHSAHRSITDCNACHVPHDSFIRKYYFKASDGLRHATIFTLRKEPQSIYIREPGKRVVQENCLRCHETLFSDGPGRPWEAMAGRRDVHCLDCHRNTPHDRVNSISSTQFAITPTLKDNL